MAPYDGQLVATSESFSIGLRPFFIVHAKQNYWVHWGIFVIIVNFYLLQETNFRLSVVAEIPNKIKCKLIECV